MKNKFIQSSILSFILGCGVFINSTNLMALPTLNVDDCTKELLLSYFPESIVVETLKRYHVSDEKIDNITKSLGTKDREIVKMVEQKAQTMNPNPLKDPQQHQATAKLFKETLLQVFSNTLKDNGVSDSSQFQAMLDDIQQQKVKKLAICKQNYKSQTNNETTKLDSTINLDSEDSNNEDEDEDDSLDEDVQHVNAEKENSLSNESVTFVEN